MQAKIRLGLALVLALALLVVAAGATAVPVVRYRVYLPIVTGGLVCPPDYRQAPDPIGGCGDKR